MDLQDKNLPTVFSVDAGDKIVTTEGSWCSFALQNDGEHLAEVSGDSLWDHISDPGLALFYKGLIGEIRRKQLKHLSFLYRCDGPQTKRLYRMVVEYQADATIRFTSFLEHSSSITKAVSEVYTATKFDLHICQNCMKVLVENIWVDICEALTAYEILKNNLFFSFTLSKCPCGS